MADAGSASCASPAPTQQRLAQILEGLRADDRAEVFLSPAVELMRGRPDIFTPEDIADYEQTIAEPMDLGTVQQKLEQGAYGSGQHALFAHDVKLIFENCKRYTPDRHDDIHIDAAELLTDARCSRSVRRCRAQPSRRRPTGSSWLAGPRARPGPPP